MRAYLCQIIEDKLCLYNLWYQAIHCGSDCKYTHINFFTCFATISGENGKEKAVVALLVNWVDFDKF